jgi:Mn2+/Fe2+ NRAMP family transporter
MKISNNRKIMNENTNSGLSNIMGWAITIFMAASSIFLLTSFLK